MKSLIRFFSLVLICLSLNACLGEIYDNPKKEVPAQKTPEITTNTPTTPTTTPATPEDPKPQTNTNPVIVPESDTWIGCTLETISPSEIQINPIEGELNITSKEERTNIFLDSVSTDEKFKISAVVARYINDGSVLLKGSISLSNSSDKLITAVNGYSFYSKGVRLSDNFTGLTVDLDTKVSTWLSKKLLYVQLKCDKICTKETCKIVGEVTEEEVTE